jgi:putative FmdB family regulatory protein
MPLYEYVCERCDARFEQLRPSSRMDDPASCPSGHSGARRVLSAFAAVSRDSYGETSSVAGCGGGACGGCSGGDCGSCACSMN